MAAYSLQFQSTDVLSATLNSGATTTTLTSGNFGSPSGTQLYVVDYDIPGTAEIISATITGTSVTGITRGLTGGAAGTTNHAAGAKIGAFFVPQHYAALTDGSGFQTGSSSVGIPAAAIKQEAWTAWVPTLGGGGSLTFTSASATIARYKRVGNICYYELQTTGTIGGTLSGYLTFTTPLTMFSGINTVGGCWGYDDQSTKAVHGYRDNTTRFRIYKADVSNWSSGSGGIHVSGFFEIE